MASDFKAHLQPLQTWLDVRIYEGLLAWDKGNDIVCVGTLRYARHTQTHKDIYAQTHTERGHVIRIRSCTLTTHYSSCP